MDENKVMVFDTRAFAQEYGMSIERAEWCIKNGLLPESMHCSRRNAVMMILTASEKQQLMKRRRELYEQS
jgi:hypothetical protein